MSNDTKGPVETQAQGYVGFANLPNQVHRKSVKKGFEFTLMVVGEGGLGKSTLINSLFLSDLYPDRKVPDAKGNGTTSANNTATSNGNTVTSSLFANNKTSAGLGVRNGIHELSSQQLLEKFHKNVKINAKTVEIEERGVKLRLTVVDTPGYGDAINNEDSFHSIVKYIDDQFEKFFHGERGLNRRNIADTRVHCCFYFISPFGHGLKPLDIEFMKQLHQKVNIVPVIARADALTKKEVTDLKKRIRAEIQGHGIKVYTLPEVDEDEDQDYKEEVRQMKEAMPFAVSGSTTSFEAKGRKVRGRVYPWGVVEIENPEHSDFIKLRNMLITHMQDLQEVTQEVHYENYRLQKLAAEARAGVKAELSLDQSDSSMDPDQMQKILQEKEAELRKMQEIMAKMQAEMSMKK